MATIPYISDEDIENKTNDLLEELSINEVPIDLEKIAKELSIDVRNIKLDDDVSGALIFDVNKPTICINEKESEARKRFTFAHEIGHFILHSNIEQLFIDKNISVALRSNKFTTKNEKYMEIQANKFAASLLMPKKLLLKELEEFDIDLDDEAELSSIAEKFEVSNQAMAIRLANIESEVHKDL